MNKYEKYEGALDVNGDINPITREPIEQVKSDNWDDMSVTELQNQKGILFGRMNTAAQFAPNMVPAIKRGIAQIDLLISSKTTNIDTGLM